MTFKDHFSTHAAEYARFRPRYPDELFATLAALATARTLAWDCGTGSGQAAIALAPHFDRVVATDPSPSQLANAEAHSKVEYRCAAAEESGLDNASIDLLSVAQAIHWFDLKRFYAEAKRVMKPGGIIAAWTYTLFEIASEIDPLVSDYYHNVIGPYWPPERKMVDDGYHSLPFPFEPIAVPAFEMSAEWSLDDLLGYLGTWSATRAYTDALGEDPCPALAARLAPHWPDARVKKRIRWPLHLRVGTADSSR